MTNLALNDGLRSGETSANDITFNEMASGNAPGYFSNVLVAGSMTASNVSTVTTSAVLTGSLLLADKLNLETAGSPYSKGIVYNFNCGAAITGGQLALISGGIVAPAAANAGKVTGIVYGAAKYASGTAVSVPVVVFGPAYLNVCTDIGDGDYAMVGSVAHMVASGALSVKSVGACIKGAASGTSSLALVFVGKL